MNKNIIFSSLIGFSLFGCSTIGEKLDVNMNLPQNYTSIINEKNSLNNQYNWWEEFNLEELNLLIKKALENNPDILISMERIKQAKSNLNIQDSTLYPTVDMNVNNIVNKKTNSYGETFATTKETKGNLGVNYELDLWDRIYKTDEKIANLSYESSKYDFETSRISLISNIINTYIQWLSINKKQEVSTKNLEIATKLYEIVNIRYENGLASKIDLSRQKTTLYSQELTLIQIKHQLNQIKTSLAILVGVVPQEFSLDYNKNLFDNLQIKNLDVGIPSDLLLKRPDIASSLAKVQTNELLIDASKIEKLPIIKINMSSSLEMTKNALFSLSNPILSSSSIGLDFTKNIFDAEKLDSQIDISQSKGQEAIQEYKKTVLLALKEVEDSMSNIEQNKNQLSIEEEILKETSNTFELSQLRYKEGILDFATFLDAQKDLFQAQESYVQQKLNYMLSMVELNKVLGGGWIKK